MKTLLQTFAFFFLISSAVAKPAAQIIFKSETGSPFRVYVDRELQNVTPATQVAVNDVEKTSVFVRIVFANAKPHQVSSFIPARQGEVLTYGVLKNSHGRWIIRLRDEAPIIPANTTAQANDNERVAINYGGHKTRHEDANPAIRGGQGGCVIIKNDDPATTPVPTATFVRNGIMCQSPTVSQVELVRFKYAITEQSDFARPRFIKAEIRNNCWTAEQVALIVRSIPNQSEQMDIAKFAYLYTINTEDYMTVVNSLRHEYQRKAVMEFAMTSSHIAQDQVDNGWVVVDESNSQEVIIDAAPCRVLSDQEFRTVTNTIANTAFQTERMEVVRGIIHATCFSTNQVGTLMQLFSFDKDKYEIAVMAFPKVIDPQNGYQLADYFDFASTRDRYTDYLVRYHPEINTPTAMGMLSAPMTDAEFARAKTAIENETFASSQKSLARQIISTNSFTIAQAKELIAVFNFDSDRLEIAKLMFDKTAENHNYYLVAEAFTFSSTKNELFDYLKDQT